MISPMIAARAYAQAQGAASGGPAAVAEHDGGPSFQQLVNNAMTDLSQSTRAAETQMAAHAQGRAELVDVVTSVASAEASLETVMAVRDQVIQAYQEIMRMPI
ncbi:MAG: flagellar hook-basal body complex protein FliE [Caulobacteraceae bacterium]|nr:flagellar hook-basal body complex protein FliE [Caulobacteraceae bacterium]